MKESFGRVLGQSPARPLLDTLEDNGFRALVVGGAVRDMLLGRIPEDVDLLTTAPLETVESLFKTNKTRQVGQAFPVCLVNGVEVASARCPGDEFPDGDLARRDLTVNAMAWDPEKNRLFDPFGGQADLGKGIIRFTGSPMDRILEDPVRMVRACRFAARLDARFHPAARAALENNAGLLPDRAAPERIRMEMIKSMALPAPSVFFRHLRDTGLLRFILPSLDRCFGLDGGPFHGETVFDHCMLVGDALPARQPLLRLAGFLHDTGKYDAKAWKEGRITFHGHETHVGAMEEDLTILRFSNAEVRRIRSLVLAHMRPLAEKTTPKSVRRLLAFLDQLEIPQADFLRLRIADKKGNLAKSPYTLSDIRLRLAKIQQARAEATALSPNHLALTGREIMTALGVESGPEVGRVKQVLFEKVLDDPSLNQPHILLDLAKKL